MTLGRSKVTSQGQISVPAEVRKRLGAGPGSTLQWDEEGDCIIVRRSGRVSSEEVHRAVFGKNPPPAKTLGQMKQGLREYIQKRHARD